jgi:hypothetical protein
MLREFICASRDVLTTRMCGEATAVGSKARLAVNERLAGEDNIFLVDEIRELAAGLER